MRILSQEKSHLESGLKLVLLPDEIMKLAKSVFPASPLCVIVHSVVSVHLSSHLVLWIFGLSFALRYIYKHFIPSMLCGFLVNTQLLLTG